MTLTTLLAAVRSYLQDPSPGVRWTDAELTGYLNEAQDDFCIKTGATQADATLSVNAKTPANAFYTLPTDLISLTQVRVNGDESPALSLPFLECRDDWETDTGTPDGYLYGPYGQSVIRVWPYQPCTVKCFYVQKPADLALGSDTPAILAVFHKYLAYGAASRAYQKDGEASALDQAASYQARFDEGVALAMANASSQPTSVPYRHL